MDFRDIQKTVHWLEHHRLRRPRTVSRQRAPHEDSLVDQDAESGFHHSLLPGTQPTVARRWSLRRRRRGGRGGALHRYPGDDGFFHAGDNDGVPEPSQPPKSRRSSVIVTPRFYCTSRTEINYFSYISFLSVAVGTLETR